MDQKERNNQNENSPAGSPFRDNVCYFIPWGLAVLFLALFFAHLNPLDLSNPQNINPLIYLFLILGVTCALLPCLQRVRIGNLIELERKLEATKNDVRLFKEDIKDTVSNLAANINTISNLTTSISSISNTINIYIPAYEILHQANEEMTSLFNPSMLAEYHKVRDGLKLDNENIGLSLARTRIKLELLLFDILNEQKDFTMGVQAQPDKISLSKLIAVFVQRYPPIPVF